MTTLHIYNFFKVVLLKINEHHTYLQGFLGAEGLDTFCKTLKPDQGLAKSIQNFTKLENVVNMYGFH